MVSVLNFPNVKYEDIKNAKDIKIIYGEIGEGYRENLDIKLTEREGIKYPGEINYEEDLKGGFYDVKRENGMIKFYKNNKLELIYIIKHSILPFSSSSENFIRYVGNS